MDGSKSEESLAVRGWQRAGAISLLLGSAELAQRRGLSVPQHLYASDPEKADQAGSNSRRPKQTLIPLAQRLDLIISADWLKGQEAELSRDALSRPGTSLISWQHELIPDIAAAIPGGNFPQTRTGTTRGSIWSGSLIFYRMARTASRSSTKHSFLATWMFDIRNIDYFAAAGRSVDNSGGEHHGCHS